MEIFYKCINMKPSSLWKRVSVLIKPVMTYATTTMRIYIAYNNLSAAINHYDTHNDLCSTIMDILWACNNLSTAANPMT